MIVTLKILSSMLDAIRQDLSRPHSFAHERVGFVTASAAYAQEELVLLARRYMPVADEDYEFDPSVGARIGSDAMRKAAQSAYRPAGAVLHIHTHGGRGRPGFSGVDLKSADEFVPGFFETAPRMPHGLLVLSDNSVHGQIWRSATERPFDIAKFVRVGAFMQKDWGTDYGLA